MMAGHRIESMALLMPSAIVTTCGSGLLWGNTTSKTGQRRWSACFWKAKQRSKRHRHVGRAPCLRSCCVAWKPASVPGALGVSGQSAARTPPQPARSPQAKQSQKSAGSPAHPPEDGVGLSVRLRGSLRQQSGRARHSDAQSPAESVGRVAQFSGRAGVLSVTRLSLDVTKARAAALGGTRSRLRGSAAHTTKSGWIVT